MQHLHSGEILEGRYRIESLLASGGQAHVYRGTHLVLGRPVAVKVLKTDVRPDLLHQTTRRFEQEARLISGLRDPHTITLYDFGKLWNGALFMVFEYIDGVSLKEFMGKEGPLAAHRVAKIMRQTLASLQEAHAMEVLHRDIKPQNIMIYAHAGRSDQVKLLDFGIAKILRANQSDLEEVTAANSVVGTPRYLAPELFQGKKATAASDLYALGLVAYEMLLGQPAVAGNTPLQVLRNLVAPMSVRIPANWAVPLGLRSIVHRLLEKDPSRRYTKADEVLLDLQFWNASEAVAELPQVHVEPIDVSELSQNAAYLDTPTRRLTPEMVMTSWPPTAQPEPSRGNLPEQTSPTRVVSGDLFDEDNATEQLPQLDANGQPIGVGYGQPSLVTIADAPETVTESPETSVLSPEALFNVRSEDHIPMISASMIEPIETNLGEESSEDSIADARTEVLKEFPPVLPRSAVLRRKRRGRRDTPDD